jgi:hypothetical protein
MSVLAAIEEFLLGFTEVGKESIQAPGHRTLFGSSLAPQDCGRFIMNLVARTQKETFMVISLDRELEAALKQAASHRGVAPEVLALTALRERFLGLDSSLQPRDEWERGLLEAARDCGVSLPDSALTSEGLYD